MTDTADLLVRIDATTEQLRRELKAAEKGVTGFQRKVQRTLKKVKRSFTQTQRSIGGFKTAIAGLGAALAVREIVQASDQMAKLRGQLGLVTDSQEELNETYERALALANETGQSTESTVNLYARLARSTEQLNLAQDDLFTMTKAVNQSFIVSGASAQEANSAILQLSQGMASGVLRGEELNSVMENSPRLANAIADGLGTTIGALREMGAAGELTAEKVSGALLATADSIEKEFNDMPMTIGRVMQTLSNDINDALGQVDASPLIEGVEELRAVISDPEFREGIVILAQGLMDVVTQGAQALATLAQLVRFFKDNVKAAVGIIDPDDLVRLSDRVIALRKEIEFFEKESVNGSKHLDGLRIALKEAESQFASAFKRAEEAATGTANLGEASKKTARQIEAEVKALFKLMSNNALKNLPKLTKEQEKALVKLNKEREKAAQKIKDQAKAAEDLRKELEFELSLVGESEREQERLTAEREISAIAIGEQADELVRLRLALFDANAAMKESSETVKTATEELTPFQKALQDTAARIDEAFAGAWRGAFDGFSQFADSLKDAFKNLLAELAHIAITRPIVMSIAAGAGLGSSTATAAGAGVLGAGGISGIGGAIAGAGAGAFNMLGQGASFLADFGVPGMNELSIRAFQQGMTSTLSSVAFNAGAGIFGGLVGNQVFGSTSGLGAGAGGLVGAALGGPLGAGIGSFVGTGIESALGNVFGFGGKGGNQAGRANLNLGTGAFSSFGVGKSFDQANVDAATDLAQTLKLFSDTIGGSTADLRIKVGNTSGLAFNGQKFGRDSEAFLAAAFKTIIEGSTSLSKTVKTLVQNFKGTAQETMQFAEAIAQLNRQIETNPVTVAVEEFAKAQEAAGRTLTETYGLQLQEIKKLILFYDGSAQATGRLNAAMAINKDLAFQMAIALQAVGESISQAVRASTKFFQDAVRTPDEKLQANQKALEFWFAALPSLQDAEQIKQVADELLRLNQAVFEAGSPELQRANVGTFIDFASEVGRVADAAIASATENLSVGQDDLNAKVGIMLDNAAAAFQQPADTMQAAAELMFSASQIVFNGFNGRNGEVAA